MVEDKKDCEPAASADKELITVIFSSTSSGVELDKIVIIKNMTHHVQVADSIVNKLQKKLQRKLRVRQLLTGDSTGDTMCYHHHYNNK